MAQIDVLLKKFEGLATYGFQEYADGAVVFVNKDDVLSMICEAEIEELGEKMQECMIGITEDKMRAQMQEVMHADRD